MEEKHGKNNKMNFDKNVLELFYRLCDKNTNIRLNACARILNIIWKKQQEADNANHLSKDLEYCIHRLLKGLSSPRDAARLGYTLLLTEILKKFNTVLIEDVLELMQKHLSITGNQDKRDLVFGQLFAYTAIIRSGRLPSHRHLSEVILSLYDLSHGKNYIVNGTYEVLLDIFSQLTCENFKTVWPELKKKLPSDWDTCSADSLCLLLLCIRMFPDCISGKYMKKHWGAEDIFASENLNNFKKIIKKTTSTLPNVHPLCLEFLLHTKQRKNFSEIWSSVVDENLFDHEPSEKSFIGFEMIKLALQGKPKKKLLKIVLSPKFQALFSKSFLKTKHPMNPAACHLAEFLCTFVKNNTVPENQMIILKTFLQPNGTSIVLLDEILKKKEVSLIVQNLVPDAVKVLCDILKTIFLKRKSCEAQQEENINTMRRCQAVQQIANLVAHPVILTDNEWRLDVIQFLFLHSFFTIKETSSEIPHCENIFEPLPDTLRDACTSAFFKCVNSLRARSEKQHLSLNDVLDQLLSLVGYADKLMNSPDNVQPEFSVESIQESWNHLKTMVQKLRKQSLKDGLINESNAFQAFFLHLGFYLFQDPDLVEVLEELYICCKKSLKYRKHDTDSTDDKEDEPSWIGVIVDIFLSLLSKSSKILRNLVTYLFLLFCPFINSDALQQILDVINPKKSDEDVLMDESVNEGEQDADFGSCSSSDESDDDADNHPVDEGFKKKIKEALGPAADDSDVESVVLSDTEMFKLDDALSEAFKSNLKTGHTQIRSEEKTLLNFRTRCLDLITLYLKSEPPMNLVLMCLEPLLAAFEFGHRNKHQDPLLMKTVSVLKSITKIRKFQNHDGVSKSELKRLLDLLIPRCHQEINMSTSQMLSSLCVFVVLCYRKLENTDSPNKKKKSKIPSYIQTYLSAMESFVSSGSSHMLPNFFTLLMEACPDLSWHFIEPCKNYAFSSNTRLFKKTQCLGLLSEALKYAKNQKEISDDQWLELANNLLPPVIEGLKNILENPDIKQVYYTELLNIIYTLHLIVNEKTKQSVLQNYTDLLPLLTEANDGKVKNLNKKGKLLKSRIIMCLGGKIENSEKSQLNNEVNQGKKRKRKLTETGDDLINCTDDDNLLDQPAKRNLTGINENIKDCSDTDNNAVGKASNRKRNSTKINKHIKDNSCDDDSATDQPSEKSSMRINESITDCKNGDLSNQGKQKKSKKKKSKANLNETIDV